MTVGPRASAAVESAAMRPDFTDTISDFAARLEDAGISYMFVGSFAAQFYGLRRTTQDTDVIVDIKPRHLRGFVSAFRDGYFVQEEMVEDSIRTGLMFNIFPVQGLKFDIIPLKDDAFERLKFERREVFDWHDYPIWVTRPEDLVLSKLEWARESRSERQLADIRAIMAAGAFDESETYFQQWLGARALRETLDACREAGYDA